MQWCQRWTQGLMGCTTMTSEVIVPERSQGLKWGCVWSPQGRPLESLWIPVEIL